MTQKIEVHLVPPTTLELWWTSYDTGDAQNPAREWGLATYDTGALQLVQRRLFPPGVWQPVGEVMTPAGALASLPWIAERMGTGVDDVRAEILRICSAQAGA